MVKKISKLDVTLGGLINCVSKSVATWKPVEAKREIQYSAALAEYLREACPEDIRVETEYRHGGTTADVWLSWTGHFLKDEVFFELKRNLEKKTDYDRLVGQIEALKPRDHNVIVVLVGGTSKELLGRLKEHYEDLLGTQSLLVPGRDNGELRIVTVNAAPP